MADLDWFPVEPGRYLKNTLHLTTRQHGAYWLLIMAAFESRGVLPGTDQALMAITKLTPKEWKQDGAVLKAFLTWRGDVWVHEFAKHQREDAEARLASKSAAGQAGAKKRWEGRRNGAATDGGNAPANGTAIAPPSNRQWQTDAHLQEQEQIQDVTTASSVSDSARATDGDPGYDTAAEPVDDLAPPTTLRRLSPGRAQPIPEDWLPAEDTQRELAKSRPDLTPERINQRTIEFRAWCLENNTQSHNFDASWLKFMVKTYAERTNHPSQVHSQRSPAHDGIRAARARRSVLAGD